MKQFSSKKLVESFGYKQLDEFTTADAWDTTKNIVASPEFKSTAATAATGAVAGKVASKMLGKAIPGVGTALSWKDAYDKWQEGDRSGAVISALAGGAYLVPGLGTAAGIGLDAINIGRSLAGSSEEPPDGVAAQPVTMKAGNAGKLAQLQQLIGAKPDGIYGPETKEKLRIWQRNNGIKDDGVPGPETYTTAGIAESKGNNMKKITTIAEDIAALRDILSSIENHNLGEGWMDTIGKGAEAAAKVARIKPPAGVPAVFKEPGLPAIKNTGGLSGGTGGSGGGMSGTGGIGGDIDNVGGALARRPGGSLSATGPKGEFVGGASGKGGIPSGKPGDISDAAFRDIGKKVSAMGPRELEKLSKSAISSPKLAPVEKEAIKKLGIANWLKKNPGKASLISGIAGFGLGYGIGNLSHSAGPQSVSDTDPHGGRGDPDIMKKQEMLNSLTGSNLKIDGIWGPETQAAADAWYKTSSDQNATMQSDLAKIKTGGVDPVQANIDALNKKAADAQEKAKADQAAYDAKTQSMAESIADLRDRLAAIDSK